MENKIKFQSEAYKEKVSFVKEFLEHNFQKSIFEFINENEWEEDANLCVNLLEDNLTSSDLDYTNEKLNLSHLKDRRTPQEYGCDLILGWIVEDGILKILTEKLNLKCNLSSADKGRKILKKPKSTADLKIENQDGQPIFVELVKDYNGYWLKNGTIELRDNKYLNLKKENGTLLGIDFKNGKFFVLPINETEATYIKFHRPYHKPAYSLSLNETRFHDQKEMKPVLIEYFNRLG